MRGMAGVASLEEDEEWLREEDKKTELWVGEL